MNTKISLLVVGALLLSSLISGGWLYYQNQQTDKIIKEQKEKLQVLQQNIAKIQHDSNTQASLVSQQKLTTAQSLRRHWSAFLTNLEKHKDKTVQWQNFSVSPQRQITLNGQVRNLASLERVLQKLHADDEWDEVLLTQVNQQTEKQVQILAFTINAQWLGKLPAVK